MQNTDGRQQYGPREVQVRDYDVVAEVFATHVANPWHRGEWNHHSNQQQDIECATASTLVAFGGQRIPFSAVHPVVKSTLLQGLWSGHCTRAVHPESRARRA
eukprot:3068120-Prymnesium_polylepis.1